MKSVLALGALVAGVTAQQSLYGQCGGQGWTGPSSCSAGATCTMYNAYYAQCIPGAATTAVTTTKSATTSVQPTTTPVKTTTSSVKTTTSSVKITTSSVKPTTTPATTSKSTTSSVKPTTTAVITTTAVTTSKSTTSATKTTSGSSGTRPSGFPYASGTNFYLDGKKFFFAGSNAYFIPMYGPNDTVDMDAALDAFAATGMKVLRTWAFADFAGPQQDYVTVFQNWSTVPPQILTTQEIGLPRLDYVVAGAEKRGIKLILPFTNNWGDYGGADLYVTSVLGSAGTHGDFYSNTVIKQYYKNYINAVVSRYKNSPAIFSWELMNEPRCSGSTLASGTCSIALINSWASEMSTYVKSLDPWHMVAIGDEGFINNPGASDYMYSGGAGIDNQALTALSTIDFGTFHMYPSSWSETWEWGNQWILDHANISKVLNKPYVLEEYAVTRSSGVRDTYMAEYHNTTFNSIIAGDMFWQFGVTVPNWGKSYDDGNSIYPEDSDWQTLVVDWAAKMASKNT